MERPSTANQFLDQLTERLQRLKEYRDLCGTDTIRSLDQSVKKLRAEMPTSSQTGVPPPIDDKEEEQSDSLVISSPSYGSEVFQQSFDKVQQVQVTLKWMKKENLQMQSNLRSSLDAFKKVNEIYLQQEVFCESGCDETVNISKKNIRSHTYSILQEETWVKVAQQIESLQQNISSTNSLLIKSQTGILTKEVENLEIRHRINKLEESVFNIRQSFIERNNCKCVVF